MRHTTGCFDSSNYNRPVCQDATIDEPFQRLRYNVNICILVLPGICLGNYLPVFKKVNLSFKLSLYARSNSTIFGKLF